MWNEGPRAPLRDRCHSEDCAPPLPGAEKGGAQSPQRSKNARNSESPQRFSGTARRESEESFPESSLCFKRSFDCAALRLRFPEGTRRTEDSAFGLGNAPSQDDRGAYGLPRRCAHRLAMTRVGAGPPSPLWGDPHPPRCARHLPPVGEGFGGRFVKRPYVVILSAAKNL